MANLGSILRNAFGKLGKVGDSIGDFFKDSWSGFKPWLNAIFKGPANLLTNLTHSGLTDEQEAMNAYNTSERVAAEQHQEYLMQNQMQWAAEDYKKAGINPMMIASGGAPSVSTPSPATASQGSASSFGIGDLLSFMLESKLLPAQEDLLRSQAEANRASAEERKSKIPFWEQSAEKAMAQVDLIKEQIKTESSKQEFYLARAVLANVNAQNIQYLQESVKEWYDSSARENDAIATANMIHALYEKGLIDAGYIDKLVELTCAEAYEAYQSGKEHAAGADLKDKQGNLVSQQTYYQEVVNSLKDGTFTKTFMTDSEDSSFFDRLVIQGSRLANMFLPMAKGAESAAQTVAVAAGG